MLKHLTSGEDPIVDEEVTGIYPAPRHKQFNFVSSESEVSGSETPVKKRIIVSKQVKYGFKFRKAVLEAGYPISKRNSSFTYN